MQVPDPGRPVRQPLDPHRAEHRLQRADVTGLEPGANHALIAGHPLQALLSRGPQRQMIINQPTQQLPAVYLKPLLKLRMRQPGSVCRVQEADQRLKLLPAAGKGRCTIAASPPGGQEFIARGVKFAATGVEIGGHVGHLRGRRWM